MSRARGERKTSQWKRAGVEYPQSMGDQATRPALHVPPSPLLVLPRLCRGASFLKQVEYRQEHQAWRWGQAEGRDRRQMLRNRTEAHRQTVRPDHPEMRARSGLPVGRAGQGVSSAGSRKRPGSVPGPEVCVCVCNSSVLRGLGRG